MAETGRIISRAARTLARSAPRNIPRVRGRTAAAAPTTSVHACGPVTGARAMSSSPSDAPTSIVAMHISGAAGVAPSSIPSPMLDPHAAGNRVSEAGVEVNINVSSAVTLDAVSPAAVRSGDVGAASAGKVEEEEDAADAAASTAAVTYGRPTHPYELNVHVPPKYARREFGQLFRGIEKPSVSGMSLITLAVRTKNDMATWSSEIVEEREQVMKQFHALAARTVENLRAAGHWADYIDPASGEPHYAARGSSRFLETDDRLSLYGYRVLDYGCCKAVSHPQWGTHVVVGAVFTDAPTEIVKRLAAVVSSDSPSLPGMFVPQVSDSASPSLRCDGAATTQSS